MEVLLIHALFGDNPDGDLDPSEVQNISVKVKLIQVHSHVLGNWC